MRVRTMTTVLAALLLAMLLGGSALAASSAEVGAIDVSKLSGARGKTYAITWQVTIVDSSSGDAIANSAVTATITNPNGTTKTLTRVTDANGVATFTVAPSTHGDWTLTVTGVSSWTFVSTDLATSSVGAH